MLPFGLRYGPGKFSKVLKPVMAFLRVTWGILIASYMDDIFIQGSSPSQVCLHALFPKQQTTLLGFIFVSVSMTVCCPSGRFTWENFDGHLHGWYSHQGVLLSTGAFICTWGYFTVLGSGLVPNLEEGCFFPKSTGYPFLTFTHLGFVLDSVSMTAPWPPVGITRLQLMCRSVEDIVIVHGA